jgi:uncharacterized protein
MNKSVIINFLHQNKAMMESKYQVKQIGLFGSYVKEMQTDESDIDILVDMPSSFDAYYDLKEFLENNLHKKVDLGLITVREHLKEKILNEVEYVR